MFTILLQSGRVALGRYVYDGGDEPDTSYESLIVTIDGRDYSYPQTDLEAARMFIAACEAYPS